MLNSSVIALADDGSIRRCDIIVKDKSKRIVLDPTITFEISNAQPKDINGKKI